MKKIFILACLVMALLLSTGTTKVWATNFTYIDYYNPSDVKLDGSPNSVSYTHNINDDGFDPLTHTINSANLSINVRDDGDSDDGHWFLWWWISGDPEGAQVTIDGIDFGTHEVDNADLGFSVASYLQNDGILNVTITRSYGDFWFNASTLTVEGEIQNVIPEPGTFLLLGCGLLGLVGLSRKKLFNK